MVFLDVRTLVFVGAIMGVPAALALTVVARFGVYRGLGHWAGAVALATVGFLLVALREVAADWLSIVIANALMVAATIFVWLGARAFVTQRPVHPAWVLAGILPFIPIMGVVSMFGDIAARTVLVETALAIPTFAAGVELLRRGGERLVMREIAACALFAHGVILLSRVILAPMLPSSTLFSGGLAVELYLLEAVLCLPIFVILFCAMVAELAMRTVRHHALFDPDSRVFNAAGFLMMLEKELGRGRRSVVPMTLLIADFDRGAYLRQGVHEDAEAAQRFFAICRQTLREQDTLGHLADGRYAVILPATHLGDGLRIAQRLRVAFSSSWTAVGSGARTVSIGVATMATSVASVDVAVAAAGEAQVRAAESGGDRVERAAAVAVPIPM